MIAIDDASTRDGDGRLAMTGFFRDQQLARVRMVQPPRARAKTKTWESRDGLGVDPMHVTPTAAGSLDKRRQDGLVSSARRDEA
jgi:hypothetical protein